MLTKKCNCCGESKPICDYGKRSASKDGLHYYCKSCANNKSTKWSKENSDYVNKKRRARYRIDSKKYLERTNTYKKQNADKVYNSNKNYRKNNPENQRLWQSNYYFKNKQKCNLAIQRWREQNYWKCSEYNASRRASSLNASLRLDIFSQKQIKQIYRDAKIISEETGIPHHVDHIVPLRAKNCCGLHVPWNLQIIPASVNVSKGNKMPSKEDCIALRLAAR